MFRVFTRSIFPLLKKLLEYLANSNLYIAFCALSLTIFCELSLSPSKPFFIEPVHLFIFFATLFTYNYHRLIYSKSANKLKYLLAFVAFVSSIVTFYYFNRPAKQLSLILGIVCLAYPLKISRAKSLRSIPYLKTVLIAIVWAFVIVILPQLSYGIRLGHIIEDEKILFWFSFILLFVYAEAFVFDIRDIGDDRDADLSTLANRLGFSHSKLLNFTFFLLIALGAAFSLVSFKWQSPIFWSLLFPLSTGALFTLNINKHRSKLYYSLGVESILTMPLIIFVLIQLFLS